MSVDIQPIQRPDWTPLPQAGCVHVDFKALIRRDHVALAMLRFGRHATIHEHPADFDVDVICLEGSGFTSVGGEQAPIHAGQRAHWPAGQPHRLWTADTEMVTLMVEHIQAG